MLRLLFFVTVLSVALLLEFKLSYQKRNLQRKQRWPANFFLIISASLFVSIFKSLGLFSVSDFGVLRFLHLPFTLEIIVSLILLDFFIYLQHVLIHKIPLFWRFHVIHHSDIDLDASSALRFHPVEILGSFFYKVLLILIFGFKIEALLLFEVILSSMTIFNHSNLYIPKHIEKALRLFIVTPQMHLIHHSTDRDESDTNYGFNLSCWDYFFKTYKAKMRDSSVVGQKIFRSVKDNSFMSLLIRPFLRSQSE